MIDLKGETFQSVTVKVHSQLERKKYPGNDVIRPRPREDNSVIYSIDSDPYCWQCIKQPNIKIHGNPQMTKITTRIVQQFKF